MHYIALIYNNYIPEEMGFKFKILLPTDITISPSQIAGGRHTVKSAYKELIVAMKICSL